MADTPRTLATDAQGTASFPDLAQAPSGPAPASPSSTSSATRRRPSYGMAERLRSASNSFVGSSPPSGMWSATGQAAGRAPSLGDIRRGSYNSVGSDGPGRRKESSSSSSGARPRHGSARSQTGELPTVQQKPLSSVDDDDDDDDNDDKRTAAVVVNGEAGPDLEAKPPPAPPPVPDDDGLYPNGYRFPPKKTWGQATAIGLRALWRFALTPLGFLIVLYGLNVVAWGAMLFFVLLNAAPAMCRLGNGGYDCNDIDSPRRVWVEIDSQILTALFCVTAFGLVPWRFRDLYLELRWRALRDRDALRRLAAHYRGWVRLPGSDSLPAHLGSDDDAALADAVADPAALPLPATKAPDPPLTGARAPPTAPWKIDFYVQSQVWNTLFQIVLCVFMWHYDRYARPSWATGLFVALGCIVAALGGLVQLLEAKRIKAVEGIPPDTARELRDIEKGSGSRSGSRGRGEGGGGGGGGGKAIAGR